MKLIVTAEEVIRLMNQLTPVPLARYFKGNTSVGTTKANVDNPSENVPMYMYKLINTKTGEDSLAKPRAAASKSAVTACPATELKSSGLRP
mmetsp:Transcript_146809/g.256127  ORF Transcript_146809/g.256127 Transcript_146809/m.256127 type:complete len:91 (-) Transcript_146809:1005-1277(-)